MRGAVLYGPRGVRFEERDAPTNIEPTDAIIRISTGMSPLQFVTRQRITRAQQLIRETSRSLIQAALEVGYAGPSHFAKVFRRVTGVTPVEFRNSL